MLEIKTKHVHFAGSDCLPAIVELLKDKQVTIVTCPENIAMLKAKLPKHNVVEFSFCAMRDREENRLLLMPWDNDVDYHGLWVDAEVWTYNGRVGSSFVWHAPHTLAHCIEGHVQGLTTYGKE